VLQGYGIGAEVAVLTNIGGALEVVFAGLVDLEILFDVFLDAAKGPKFGELALLRYALLLS
jgi:hypothetical protein